MKGIPVKMIRTREVARDTCSFQFDLQGNRFEFRPGQFINLSLPNQPALDQDNRSRTLSVASSPKEQHLMVATRMTGSPFKKALTAMQHGELAQVDGPQGRFLLDVPETVPVVLLAGGIGITPFRSMIKYAMERGTSHQMLLVYSNHTPADAPFLDELQHWANERDNLSLVTTMTQPEKCPPSWNGKTGRIDAEFLRKNIQDLPASVFYSAGPPRFVKAMKQSLQDAGVSEEHIHAEEFSGY